MPNKKIAAVKILMVEDHEAFRSVVRHYLDTQKTEFEIREVSSAEAAIDEASEFKPDMVLMDVRLPDMNGIEAAQRIKSIHPPSIIIVLSMFATKEWVRQRNGVVTAFVDKNRLWDDLMPLLNKYINGRNNP